MSGPGIEKLKMFKDLGEKGRREGRGREEDKGKENYIIARYLHSCVTVSCEIVLYT